VEWRGGHFQDANVTAAEVLRPLSNAGDVIQQATTIVEQLLAFPGQQEATSDAIEQLETEFLLKVAYVPGQSGLSDAQAQRCLRDSAKLGYGDERPYVPQIHADLYAGSL
jgi:hypothetical protein